MPLQVPQRWSNVCNFVAALGGRWHKQGVGRQKGRRSVLPNPAQQVILCKQHAKYHLQQATAEFSPKISLAREIFSMQCKSIDQPADHAAPAGKQIQFQGCPQLG